MDKMPSGLNATTQPVRFSENRAQCALRSRCLVVLRSDKGAMTQFYASASPKERVWKKKQSRKQRSYFGRYTKQDSMTAYEQTRTYVGLFFLFELMDGHQLDFSNIIINKVLKNLLRYYFF